MRNLLSVAEAVGRREELNGCCVSIRGTLRAGFQVSYLVSDPVDREAMDQGILISDPGFFPCLLENLPAYIGGQFAFEDPVVITGTLQVRSNGSPFGAGLTDIHHLEVEREELETTVIYSWDFHPDEATGGNRATAHVRSEVPGVGRTEGSLPQGTEEPGIRRAR